MKPVCRGLLLGVLWIFCFLFQGGVSASASSEIDRQFDLGSIGALRAWDNTDGVFGEYVAGAFKTYFSRENRFIYNDLSRADSVLMNSKIPYSKIIDDGQIIGQLARSTRTESILRTKVVKMGARYQFTIDWLHSPGMEVMSSISFFLDEPQGEGATLGSDLLNEAFETNLPRLFLSVPFQASVSGRDQKTLTVNTGSHSQIKVGDTLIISTLDAVKIHPLLKSVVDWQFTKVGEARVEQTEDGMAFCQITQEEVGREIGRSQKVTRVVSGDENQAHLPPRPEELSQPLKDENFVPRIGWVGGGLFVGPHGWQYSSSNPAVINNGGGLAIGGNGFAQLWFTRDWFFEFNAAYGFWNFSQTDTNTGSLTTVSSNGGVAGSLFTIKGEVGYSFLVNGNMTGPKAWVKAGYKSSSFSLPRSTTENTGPLSISSFVLGFGGDMPFQAWEQPWGALLNVSLKIFSSASATWVNDTVNGSTDLEVFVGGYRRLTPRMNLRAGFDFLFTGVDFTAGTSISQKTITFGPSILYYL